jgi:predicted small metal-binding protein
MLQIRCADAGTVCPSVVQALTGDELHRQMAAHLSREHHVKRPTRTIMNYMTSLTRTVEGPPLAGEKEEGR